MIILFYVSGFIAVFTTICVILNTNPIYALLYLISSLLSVSFNLFALRAPFAGAIEIIIYAGAIMVLFIFAIMIFNINHVSHNSVNKEPQFLPIKYCFGVFLLMSNLLVILLYFIFKTDNCFINVLQSSISFKRISIALFGPYMIAMEIASFLLLSALVSVLHIAQEYKILINFNSIQLSESKK